MDSTRAVKSINVIDIAATERQAIQPITDRLAARTFLGMLRHADAVPWRQFENTADKDRFDRHAAATSRYGSSQAVSTQDCEVLGQTGCSARRSPTKTELPVVE